MSIYCYIQNELREGSNEDEEEDLEDQEDDIRRPQNEDQSTSSSTNPHYEKTDGGSSGDVECSSTDHLVENDNNKGQCVLMTPTTIQVNITRDSQDRTSEEEEADAVN